MTVWPRNEVIIRPWRPCSLILWGYDDTLTTVYPHPVRLRWYLDDHVRSSSEVTMPPWQQCSLAMRLRWDLDGCVPLFRLPGFPAVRLWWFCFCFSIYFCFAFCLCLPLLFPLPSSRRIRRSSSVRRGSCHNVGYVWLGNVEHVRCVWWCCAW